MVIGVDTDMFCLKKFYNNNKYLFVSEPNIYYKKSIINSGILLFPKNDLILLDAINICNKNKKKYYQEKFYTVLDLLL